MYLFILAGLWFELSSQVHASKAYTLLPEPYLQSVLLWLFWTILNILNYLPGLASNRDPPDLCLPGS
jgi:hypothetical protein